MAKLPWLRLYHRIIDDDKIRLLAFEDRWHFIALLCLKCEGLLDNKKDAMIERKIALKLGVQLRELDEIKRRLSEVGLVDDSFNPVAWDDLQFKSDSSTGRVREYRKRIGKSKTSVSETEVKRFSNGDVTVQETDEDTETDKEVSNSLRSLEGNRAKKIKRKVGTRLPDDWHISDTLAEWIRSKGYSRKFVLHEIEKFKNFWIAKTKDATKLDWDATARNWLLRAAERETKNEKAPTVGDTFVKLAREMGVLNDEQQFNSEAGLFSEGDSFGRSAVHGVVIEYAEPEGSERNDFAERLLNRS